MEITLKELMKNNLPEECRCGVQFGECHKPGCDIEECPFCHGQLISCGCCYNYNIEFGSDGEMTEKGAADWEKILQKQRPVPYGKEIFLVQSTLDLYKKFSLEIKIIGAEKYS